MLTIWLFEEDKGHAENPVNWSKAIFTFQVVFKIIMFYGLSPLPVRQTRMQSSYREL